MPTDTLTETASGSDAQLVAFGPRLDQLAGAHPQVMALVEVAPDGRERKLDYGELAAEANAGARLLAELGVTKGDTVMVGYPNVLEHFIATWAAWKLGALVLPLNWQAPAAEREEFIALAGPAAVLADWESNRFLNRHEFNASRPNYDASSVPPATADPGYAMGSGGSTGRSKIIVLNEPLTRLPGETMGAFGKELQFDACRTQLVPGPLYHNMPFGWANHGLFAGQTVVVMQKFEASQSLQLIQKHNIEFAALVPTMMQRMLRSPVAGEVDLSSLRTVLHSAAACPEWLKRAWIEWIGPHKIWEGFGSTEGVGLCLIRGDEWLEHPGSVGRPFHSEVRVLDDDGIEVPAGVVGELFMRPIGRAGLPFEYRGSPPARSTEDGFVSVGDMGWVDTAGYVFSSDRRADLIITGGHNVYPAEVEAVLLRHPKVFDVAVVGLPHEDYGATVHAVVQPAAGADPRIEELDAFCRSHLAAMKLPRSYRFCDSLPRNEAGKIRRRLLAKQEAAQLESQNLGGSR